MSHASPRSTRSPRRERAGPPQSFELLQVVYVRHARPDVGVQRGECGTVVELFERPNRAYYVEFVNEDGTTRAEGAFTAEELAGSPLP
jgi:uncharacterized protein DUF4926